MGCEACSRPVRRIADGDLVAFAQRLDGEVSPAGVRMRVHFGEAGDDVDAGTAVGVQREIVDRVEAGQQQVGGGKTVAQNGQMAVDAIGAKDGAAEGTVGQIDDVANLEVGELA